MQDVRKRRGGAGNFANNRDRAVACGRAGGTNSGGNFKHDPARAAAAGRKGGTSGNGNFKRNPERAAEAGRKGGHTPRRRETVAATPESN